MYEVGLYRRAEPEQQFFLTMLFTYQICHEKITFDIWQHSSRNKIYLLQSTYESNIKKTLQVAHFPNFNYVLFIVVSGIA